MPFANGAQGKKPALHRLRDAGIGEASFDWVLEKFVCACGVGDSGAGFRGGGYAAYQE